MRFVTKKDFDFSKAARYRKTIDIAKEHVRRAEKEEWIVTHHSLGKETENVARVGDYIIRTSDEDDGYVISGERFFQTYEEHPNNPNVYRNIKTRLMLMTLEDIRFVAPWGQEMNVKAGGMVSDAGTTIYGVDRFSFMRNFGRVDSTKQKTIFCLANEPLDVQLQKAYALNEIHHVHDIMLRLQNPNLFVKRDA